MELADLKLYVKNRNKHSGAYPIYQKALRDGKIVRAKKCMVCDFDVNIVGHHYDYLKPISVYWLCSGCHHSLHTLIKIKEEKKKLTGKARAIEIIKEK